MLFTDSDAFAGTERHILDLAHGLRESGVCVRIACPDSSPLANRARNADLTVFPVPKCGKIDYHAARKIAALFQSGEIDLVHAHNGRTAIAAVLGVWLAGIGCTVFTQHFVQPGRLRAGPIQRAAKAVVHRFVNKRIDHFIAISSAVRDAMLSRADAPSDRISTILNGISMPNIQQLQSPESLRSSFGIDSGNSLVVCVARLEVEKDIESLVEAMKVLIKETPELRCIIVGEGSQRINLECQIRDAKLEKQVLMTGFREDSIACINAGDIFVLPSPAEPFGLVLLEAMAMGKPVVAIRKGGPTEIVVDGATGLLVPEAEPAALIDAIRVLCNAPRESARLGGAGRIRFEEKFSARRMAEETISVYEIALQRSRKNN